MDVTYAYELLEALGLETRCHGEFTGLAVTAGIPEDDPGPGNGIPPMARTWPFKNEFLGYVPAKKEPSLFKPAYASPRELADEFMAGLEGILPEKFDITPMIVEIEGSYAA